MNVETIERIWTTVWHRDKQQILLAIRGNVLNFEASVELKHQKTKFEETYIISIKKERKIFMFLPNFGDLD